MIAKNEEKNIERCINSYKEIVDEIIVVDTGSADNTIAIAKKLGAKVFNYNWKDDFAAAKNYALSKAIGDWIIFLDADEYFDEECTKNIKNVLKRIGTKYNCIACQIKNIDKGKNQIINSFLNIRILKKDPNIRYRNPIHESLFKYNGKLNVLALYDEIVIYHTGYSFDINELKAKRNLKIILEDIKSNGEKPDYYRYLSDCYLSLNQYENAIKYARLHIESEIKTIGYESKMYKNIIDSLTMLKVSAIQIENAIHEALDKFPNHPNFHFTYAYFFINEKKYEQALKELLLTLKYKKEYKGIETDFTEGFISDIQFKIGFIFDLKNNINEALKYYYNSLKIDKYNCDAFEKIIDLIEGESLINKIEFINSLYDINKKEDVTFIKDHLVKLKKRGILAYYTNILYKKHGYVDISMPISMLAEGKYETAFKIFFKGYASDYSDSNAILLIVSCLLSKNLKNIRDLTKIIKPSFKRIMESFIGETDRLYNVDVKSYITILRELLLFNEQDTIKTYTSLKQNFDINISDKIAKVFMDNYKYEEAIKLYEELNNENNLKNVYMSKGYCFFKLKKYDKAQSSFERAIEKGYKENDVYEFLNWIDKNENYISMGD